MLPRAVLVTLHNKISNPALEAVGGASRLLLHHPLMKNMPVDIVQRNVAEAPLPVVTPDVFDAGVDMVAFRSHGHNCSNSCCISCKGGLVTLHNT